MAKKSARIDIVDYYRFFAAVMIIFRHTEQVLGKAYYTSFFVEFFFMLSGYFIFKHFQKPQLTYAAPDQKAKTALQYTWQRFKSLMPYVIPIVLITTIAFFSISYIYWHTSPYTIINQVRLSPFEFLLFPTSMIGRNRIIGPVWYLASMVFFMPLVGFVAQSKRKNIFLMIAIPASWAYLACTHFFTDNGIDGIEAFLRGGGAMFIGGIVYYIAEWMRQQKYRTWVKIAFTILEVGLLAHATAIALLALKPHQAAIPILFFLLLICLSGQSYTSKLHSKMFTFLGAISLPLFMWHYAVVMILPFFPGFGILRRAVILFGGSIAISIIHYLIVTAVQKHRKGKKSLIFAE